MPEYYLEGARVGDHPPVVAVTPIGSELQSPNDSVEIRTIMRALDPEVFDAVWTAIEPLLPVPYDDHPLGCHNPRLADRLVFEQIVVRLVTGCSWVDAESITGKKISDTTTRTRRNEWIEAGVFRRLEQEALDAYDKAIGLDTSDVALDGSTHKAPCGGEGTGPSPVDRGKCGWKWSFVTDVNGIPLGWTIAGANRHDSKLLVPTLADAAMRTTLDVIDTLHLDKGYDSKIAREICQHMGIENTVIAEKRKPGAPEAKKPLTLGLRWPVERTNSWFSNFGQLRRNTDRKISQRLAQFGLAFVFLITAKLIDHRNRWACL